MSPLSAIGPTLATYRPFAPSELTAPGSKLPGPLGIQVPTELGQPIDLAPVQPAGDSFATMLGRLVSEVNAKQHVATDTVAAMHAGEKIPLHQTVLAMEEANVSFQLMVEVRNKLLESYQELMRMQI